MSFLESALRYAARGFSVVPAEPCGKEPMVEWTPYQTTPATEEQLRRWWEKWPDANVALVTGKVSGFVVVDVDDESKFREAMEAGPTDYIVRSARGWHLYYAYPPEAKRISNRVGDDGIDVRGDGGIIIAPPSVHHTGYLYVHEREGQMGPAPAWLLDDVVRAGEASQHWITGMLLGGLKEGHRNTGTARLSGYLYAKGIPQDVATALLQSWNARNVPPLPRHVIERTVRSVYATAARRSPFKPTSEVMAEQKPVERVYIVDQWEDKEQEEIDVGLLPYADYCIQNSDDDEQWLVEEWLPESTVAMVVAAPGSYKTWMVLDLAVSVASGLPFMGQPVRRPGAVIVLQQEDPKYEIAKRLSIIHFTKQHGTSPILEKNGTGLILRTLPHLPIHLSTTNTFSLLSQASLRSLERNIQDLKPSLVILDPLYAAGAVEDYMANTAKRLVLLKALRDHYGCSFVIVHHTKKAAREDRGKKTADREDLWGSQFLNAALETGWQLRKPDPESNQIVVVRHFKNKGAVEPITLDFGISTIDNGRTVYEVSQSKGVASDPKAALLAYLDILREEGPCTVNDLCQKTGDARSTAYRRLKRLVEQGDVHHDPASGKYSVDASIQF